jgi:hypothetical protein
VGSRPVQLSISDEALIRSPGVANHFLQQFPLTDPDLPFFITID